MRAGQAAPDADQRGQNALGQRLARQNIGDGQPHRHRRVIAAAAQPHQPGSRLRQKVLTRQVRPIGRPETRDRAIDQLRVDPAHLVMAKALSLDHAGAEILDQHIGVADDVHQQGAVGGVAQIGGQAFLAAIDGVKQRVFARHRIRDIEAPTGIARAGALDLDHPRAQIGQFQPGKWTREILRDLKNGDAFQRACHARLSR